jgi:hypothetical protein
MNSETTYKQRNYAYDELSDKAKKMLSYIYKSATLSDPLTYCRIMMEDANGEKYSTLLEVERYLIHE